MNTLCFTIMRPGWKPRSQAVLLCCAFLSLAVITNAIAQAPITDSVVFQRAKAIRIKELTLDDSTLLSAVNQLNRIGRANDPKGKGVYILLQDAARLTTEAKLTLLLKNVSLAEAAEKLCRSANLKLEVKGNYLSLNTFNPVELEHLTFDTVNGQPDMQKLTDEGWQLFSTTHVSPWVGGANRGERDILSFCRKKPAVAFYTLPF